MIKFTIDGREFKFRPLPLGILLQIEELKEKLQRKINKKMEKAYPVLTWLLVTSRYTTEVLCIVALLTLEKYEEDMFEEHLDYLREHCTPEDLCSLFMVGCLAQNIWLRDAGMEVPPSEFASIGDHDMWEIPFINVITQKKQHNNYGRN